MNIAQGKKICELIGYDGDFSVIHDTLIINVNGLKKGIRFTEMKIERMEYINELKNYIYEKGFKNIDKFYKYNENFYFELNKEYYYIFDWVESNEIELEQNEKLKLAMENMALLHKKSNGFNLSDINLCKNETGKLYNILKKRVDELIRLKKLATKKKKKFDYLYIKNCDFYIKKGIQVLKELDNDKYYKVIENATKNKEVCHRDFSLYNMRFNEDGVYILNFDYACYEMNVYDIVSFVRKIVNDNNWDYNLYENLLQYYNNIKKITEEEKYVIDSLVKFPQKFWRVVNRYYNSRKSCPDNGYYVKLEEVCNQKQEYEKFCEEIRL